MSIVRWLQIHKTCWLPNYDLPILARTKKLISVSIKEELCSFATPNFILICCRCADIVLCRSGGGGEAYLLWIAIMIKTNCDYICSIIIFCVSVYFWWEFIEPMQPEPHMRHPQNMKYFIHICLCAQYGKQCHDIICKFVDVFGSVGLGSARLCNALALFVCVCVCCWDSFWTFKLIKMLPHMTTYVKFLLGWFVCNSRSY